MFLCLQSNTKSIVKPIEFKKSDVKESVMPLPWLSGASGASFPRYPCHSCDSAQYFRCSKIEISKQPLARCTLAVLNLGKGFVGPRASIWRKEQTRHRYLARTVTGLKIDPLNLLLFG